MAGIQRSGGVGPCEPIGLVDRAAAESPVMLVEWSLRKLTKCLHLYLAETDRCGIGVFAAKPFRKGDIVVQDLDGDYYDHIYTYEQLVRLGCDLVQLALQIGDDEYLLANGILDDFMNHSCQPSAGIRLVEQGYLVIALRDIAAHEEITYDYSTYCSGSRESFSCMCHADNCRGVIGDFADLPDDLQEYYLKRDVVGKFAARPNK